MKEKFKKLFKNKDFWNFIFETICAIILVLVGYFSGFANGLLIEDHIRDNMILEINDLINEDKNEKLYINNDKKNAVQPMNYSSTLSFEQNVGLGGYVSEEIEFNLRVKYYYYFNYTINSNNVITFNNIQTKFSLNVINYDVSNTIPIYEDAETIFTSDVLTLSSIGGDYFSFNFDDILFVSLPVAYYDINTDEIYLVSVFKSNNDIVFFNSYSNGYSQLELMLYYYNQWQNSSSPSISLLSFSTTFLTDMTIYYPLNTNLNFNITNYYGDVAFDAGLSQGGASQEDLQQAWQTGFDIGYGSGVIEGKSEFINSQEYRDILKDEFNEGVQQGIQQGIDSANDADGVFDRVFMVIRNAGASFLNLFDFYIFPNMPFYVVIAIPFIISSLFILFKILLK